MKTISNSHRIIFLVIISVFCWANIAGQDDLNYKYHIGTTPPGPGWQANGFDDSSWSDGHGSIGYGDGDDTIVTGVTSSIYIRYNLNIIPYWLPSTIGLVINAKYDDGYIAYLNGKEIIRVNMDTTSHPDNLKTTIRSREATYDWRMEGYLIDSAILKLCNLDTSNILAFEAHNDSINGSDLSYYFNYAIQTSGSLYYNYWGDNYTRQVPLDSIDIPIVIIETDEYGYDSDEGRQATMGIINNGQGKYNKLSDSCNDYNGLIRVKIRGQSSQAAPKVNFRIELIDSTGENNNTKILGLPKENDFILYGPFSDQSLIHNELVFNLGRDMGYYEPRTRFCEVIVNGRDLGLYAMTENIKRDDNRVNIAKLTETDNSGLDVTGGYLFKWDKGNSEIYNKVDLVYPSFDDITSEQETYISGYLDQMNEAIYSNDFTDPYNGYRRYLDIETLADYVIINELTKNIDAYYYSCYMYKDRDDRGGLLQYGPLWDYDGSMGYSLWADLPASGWQFNEPSKPPRIHLLRILQDTSFVNLMAERWHNYRQDILNSDSIFGFIDNFVDTLKPTIDRNYEIWPTMGRLYAGRQTTPGETYEEEISTLKTWLSARLTWMDNSIDNIYKPLVIYTGTNDYLAEHNAAQCYPNPFTDHLTLLLDLETPGTILLEVYDLTGRKLKALEFIAASAGETDYNIDMTDIGEAGMYIVKVTKDNIPIISQRVVKME